MKKNEGFLERGIQLSVSALLLVVAIFWLGEIWSWAIVFLAGIIALFAIKGFCPLYILLGINKENIGEATYFKKALVAIVFFSILIGGGYASHFFTKKFFVEDFNGMNNY